MNIVMTSADKFVEVQATAEHQVLTTNNSGHDSAGTARFAFSA
jgi:hypothetical protein